LCSVVLSFPSSAFVSVTRGTYVSELGIDTGGPSGFVFVSAGNSCACNIVTSAVVIHASSIIGCWSTMPRTGGSYEGIREVEDSLARDLISSFVNARGGRVLYHLLLYISFRYKGRAIADNVETSDRLNPVNIDHAWLLTAELVNDTSDLNRSVLLYTLEVPRSTSNPVRYPAQPSVGKLDP
jgi:hypothetical protein